MLTRFAFFGLLALAVMCQAASVYNRDDDDVAADDDTAELNNQFRSLTRQQLAELDEFLSRKLIDESAVVTSGEALHRNTRRPYEHSITKRDALWTTTEVLNCIRGLKYFKSGTKLDLATEMLNCYRRLKHSG